MQRVPVARVTFKSRDEDRKKKKKRKETLAKFHPIYTLSRIRVFAVSSSIVLLSMINDVIYHVELCPQLQISKIEKKMKQNECLTFALVAAFFCLFQEASIFIFYFTFLGPA